MKVKRNVFRPVKSVSEHNRFDYIFFIILLSYIFFFAVTIRCKAVQVHKKSSRAGMVVMDHFSMFRAGNLDKKNIAVM